MKRLKMALQDNVMRKKDFSELQVGKENKYLSLSGLKLPRLKQRIH